MDDIPCGTEINAIVSEKLETIEQDHYEYIKVGLNQYFKPNLITINLYHLKFPKNHLERKSILTLEDDSEYVITQIENNQNVKLSSKLTLFNFK